MNDIWILIASLATMFLFGSIVSIARRMKEELEIGVQTLIGSILSGLIVFTILMSCNH